MIQPPAWTDQPLVLYHGTIDALAPEVLGGIDVRTGRAFTNFGQGFYTTTSLPMAWRWATHTASRAASRRQKAQPAVIRFSVDRERFVSLDSLGFARGDRAADDYWSLVWHRRTTGGDHGRPVNGGWYDIVVGPVAAVWQDRSVIEGCDRVSFHTPRGGRLLAASNPQVVP
jgi:hypothetical protein